MAEDNENRSKWIKVRLKPSEEETLNNRFKKSTFQNLSEYGRALILGKPVMGSPGAGKSYFVIRHIITQHIKKGFTMLIYDFKFDDLSLIAYNALLKYAGNYKKKPSIWFIDFDKIKHRCNPLEPGSMTDITDAMESSRTFIAKRYGGVNQLDAEIKDFYQKRGILDHYEGDIQEFPVPATYIISPEGTVIYAFVESDYRQRAEPAFIVGVIKQYQKQHGKS